MPEKKAQTPDTSKKPEPTSKFSFAKLNFSIDLDGLLRFFILVLVYGSIINFGFWAVVSFEFTVMTLLGWGCLYYLLRYEFVDWVRSMVYKR